MATGLLLLPIQFSCADDIDDEISGFTHDSTITRVGHEFARYLGDYRNTNFSQNNDYNLTVYERPSARWGSLIWVTLDNREVYRRFLPPGKVDLSNEATSAAQYIHNQAQQQQLQMLFMDTFDLAQDEY